MSRPARAVVSLLVIVTPVLGAASSPLGSWLARRFGSTPVEVRPVQGIAERIVDGKLHLNLQEFLELVLRNSTEVNLTRLDVYTSANQILATNSPLDPQLLAGFNVLKNVSPSFTQISGAATLNDLTETSVFTYQQLLPSGQTISANFNAVRTTSNDAFYFYNPDTFGTLNINILQPLLQDRTRIEIKGPQQIARTELLITTDQSMAAIATTLANAAGQYWDAVRSRDAIKVEQQTFDLAQKSYDRDKQALDLGALASLDIYQSETQVAERRRDLIEAQYTYKADLDGLRRLIGADLTRESRQAEIVLDDDPSVLPPKSSILPFEDALEAALKVRPEADAARRSIAVDDLNARIAHNLLLPRLDLSAQGSATGLSGTGVPVVGLLGNVTPIASTGFGTSLGQILSFAYPGYGGGLQFTLPFRNSSASAQLSNALVNRARDRYNERQVQQQITFDVRQAINALELADATIAAARTARDLAVKNVAAEQQKYELGTITAFEVLDSQNRLANSESALLNTFVGYQQAFVNYQRATWTLLDGLGMVLETPKVH